MTTNPLFASAAGAFVSGAMIWATIIIRVMWQFKARWDDTNKELAILRRLINDLITSDRRIAARLEGHLIWHEQRDRGAAAADGL